MEKRNKDRQRINAKKKKEEKKVEEILSSEDEVSFYRGNPKLKKAGEKINFSPEQIEEFRKCMNDPVYFVSHYVKIVHVDKGLVPIELYDYQRKVLDEFKKNRFVVLLSCRQSGKCVSGDTFITLRNKDYRNNEPVKMRIEDFFEWLSFVERMKRRGF